MRSKIEFDMVRQARLPTVGKNCILTFVPLPLGLTDTASAMTSSA